MRREGTLDGRENGLRGAASFVFLFVSPERDTQADKARHSAADSEFGIHTGRDPERNRCGL